MDSVGKFTGKASAYAAGRPAYAEAFICDLYREYGFSQSSVVADVGAGTGKFAKQLIERGTFVYCVEPNEDMRRQAEQELKPFPNSRCVAGDAACTALTGQSVDFVTAAQAFHWFDAELFREECRRILRPEGRVLLIYNMRDTGAEITQRCSDVFKECCPAFTGFHGGIRKNDLRIQRFFTGSYEKREYDHPLCYDKDTFIKRSLSSSYSLKPQDAGYPEYTGMLEALFDTCADGGTLIMPNQTVLYIGTV